ncbi:MAG TPA: HDIG domain-containing protein [Solirubrobacteraceae bacterium]|jgi:putative nucleotidyltransferase with HDIG domain|nr:HDIG domain-containing protein [Solirubrobacteraceae bacterium]
MPLPLSREEAWNLFCEWTESESLRRHALAVEAAMRAYARRFGQDEELWGQVGVLHDLDYERFPSPVDGHPRRAMAELERLGYPGEFVRAVATHADYLDVPRRSALERTLYAVDELCGFLAACAYVRPQGIHGMRPASVRKKLKQPSFAAGVDRDALRRGAAGIDVEFDDHVAFVIEVLEPHAARLGLEGSHAAVDG